MHTIANVALDDAARACGVRGDHSVPVPVWPVESVVGEITTFTHNHLELPVSILSQIVALDDAAGGSRLAGDGVRIALPGRLRSVVVPIVKQFASLQRQSVIAAVPTTPVIALDDAARPRCVRSYDVGIAMPSGVIPEIVNQIAPLQRDHLQVAVSISLPIALVKPGWSRRI